MCLIFFYVSDIPSHKLTKEFVVQNLCYKVAALDHVQIMRNCQLSSNICLLRTVGFWSLQIVLMISCRFWRKQLKKYISEKNCDKNCPLSSCFWNGIREHFDTLRATRAFNPLAGENLSTDTVGFKSTLPFI